LEDPATVTSVSAPLVRSVLRHLATDEVSRAAQKESRNREIALPPVSVYRWWARRTLAVNQAILEAFQVDYPGGPHLVIDPFAGGGVIPLAAVAQGQRVYAQDLNPWAAAGLAAAVQLPEADAILEGVGHLQAKVEPLLQRAYATTASTGEPAAISHTFRVSTSSCPSCSAKLKHFPHAMVTLHQRKERGQPGCLLACAEGHVFEGSSTTGGTCPECSRVVDPEKSYTPGRNITCWSCGTSVSLNAFETIGSWQWEVVLVERVLINGGREIGAATALEIESADVGWCPSRDLGVIDKGDETEVLLRHGFTHWADLYPLRQRAVTEALLAALEVIENDKVRSTLRWALLGTTEMAGHLSRWDRWYLKSYEAMAGHRFNFTTLAAEPNVWGTSSAGRGTFQRRVLLMVKAANWLHGQAPSPLEVIDPEHQTRSGDDAYDVRVVCGSSESLDLPSGSALLCLTDPPYHDDVQYGELSIPLRAWAGLSTDPLVGEAIVNTGAGVNSGDGDYRMLLTRIFSEVNRTLRADGHLVFSYANRSPDAWADVIEALDGAGFRCAGYAVLHSENETDHAKRNVRACTQDLILDMVPDTDLPIRRSIPRFEEATEEEAFLEIVGSYLLRTGALPRTWRSRMIGDLQQSAFLA
jgi:hypothetical protein